jgi:hypothetical protein
MEPKIERSVHKQMLKGKIKKNEVLIRYKQTTLIIKKNPENDEVISESKVHAFHDVVSQFDPHQDLLDAFNMLRKPVIDICEMGNFKAFDKYQIKGITLIGMDSDDDARVMITASKKLEHNKKPFNFNTPPATLSNMEEYSDAEKLDKFVKKVCDELWAYLDGKHAQSPQMTLEFQNGTTTNLKVMADEVEEAEAE